MEQKRNRNNNNQRESANKKTNIPNGKILLPLAFKLSMCRNYGKTRKWKKRREFECEFSFFIYLHKFIWVSQARLLSSFQCRLQICTWTVQCVCVRKYSLYLFYFYYLPYFAIQKKVLKCVSIKMNAQRTYRNFICKFT